MGAISYQNELAMACDDAFMDGCRMASRLHEAALGRPPTKAEKKRWREAIAAADDFGNRDTTKGDIRLDEAVARRRFLISRLTDAELSDLRASMDAKIAEIVSREATPVISSGGV